MSDLPETRSAKPRRGFSDPRSVPTLALALILVAAILAVVWASAGSGFSPGEEVYASGVEEIAAGAGDAPFPGPDAVRFGPGTREVRVYLRVEDLPGPARFTATVERSGRYSVLSRLFGAGDILASGGEADRLSVSENGVSGVVEFVVRTRDGGDLPAGEYTVGIRTASGGSGVVIARKYFIVGDRQA